MQHLLTIAGMLSIAASILHIFVGQRELYRPLRTLHVPPELRYGLMAAWYAVAIDLLSSALMLFFLAGQNSLEGFGFLLWFLAMHFFFYSLVFVLATFKMPPSPHRLLKLPQWILFLPLGIITMMAIPIS